MKVYRTVRCGEDCMVGEGNNLKLGYLTPAEGNSISIKDGANTLFSEKKIINGGYIDGKYFYLDFLDVAKLMKIRSKNGDGFSHDEIWEVEIPDELLKQCLLVGIYSPYKESCHRINGETYLAIEFFVPYSSLYNTLKESHDSYDENKKKYQSPSPEIKRVILEQFIKKGLSIYYGNSNFYECVPINTNILMYDEESVRYKKALLEVNKRKFAETNRNLIIELLKILGCSDYNFFVPCFKNQQRDDFDREKAWKLILEYKDKYADISESSKEIGHVYQLRTKE